MEHKTRLSPALLILLLVASVQATACSQEVAEVGVTFKEVSVTFKEGTWTFSPEKVTLEPGPDRAVLYRLDPDSSAGWYFRRVAICEDLPDQTDFIVTDHAPYEMGYHGLSVRIEELHEDMVLISFAGNVDMTLGVELTVTDGEKVHQSRDPQIVLERDDNPPFNPDD